MAIYTIILKKSGYQDSQMTVIVEEGRTTYAGMTLLVTQVVMAAGIPWWLLLGLAVGMYYTGRKAEEVERPPVPITVPVTLPPKEIRPYIKEVRPPIKEVRPIREPAALPTPKLSEEQKYLISKLRKRGATDEAKCTEHMCTAGKFVAVARRAEPIILDPLT
jgi:hypothetical protein